jgi:predicted esterase YcpF (UPF0227 family)
MTEAQIWVALGGTWTALIGVLAFGLRAIISGALVPRSTLLDSIAREKDWRAAYMNEAERGDTKDRLLDKLLVYAETADRVLQSLPKGRDDA